MAKMLLLVAGAVASRNEGTTMLQTGDVAEHRVSSNSRSERLAAMREQVLSFVENGVPGDAQAHLATIKDLLNNEVMNTLTAEASRHHEDQNGALTVPFTKASGKYETTMDPLRDANLTAVNALKTTHWDCRGAESILDSDYNTCAGELQDATDTFNSAVDDAVAKSGANDLCQESGWSDSTVSTLNSYKNAVSKVITDRGAMDAKSGECAGRLSDQQAKTGTCNADQLAYEQGECRRALAIAKAASDYNQAYSDKVDEYEVLKTSWEADSGDRLQQCKVVKTILCYVTALEENNGEEALRAAIGVCDGEDHSADCTVVEFVAGTIPDQADRDATPPTACQAGFEYSADPLPSGTALADCAACVDPFA